MSRHTSHGSSTNGLRGALASEIVVPASESSHSENTDPSVSGDASHLAPSSAVSALSHGAPVQQHHHHHRQQQHHLDGDDQLDFEPRLSSTIVSSQLSASSSAHHLSCSRSSPTGTPAVDVPLPVSASASSASSGTVLVSRTPQSQGQQLGHPHGGSEPSANSASHNVPVAATCTAVTSVHSVGAATGAVGTHVSAKSGTARRLMALHLKASTWASDSHGLFDYESRNVHIKTFKCFCKRDEYLIVRASSDVSLIPAEQLMTFLNNNMVNRQVVRVLARIEWIGGSFVLTPGSCPARPEATPIPANTTAYERLWLVVRSLRERLVCLKPNDVVKLGRFRLRVKEQVLTADEGRVGDASDDPRFLGQTDDECETVAPGPENSIDGLLEEASAVHPNHHHLEIDPGVHGSEQQFGSPLSVSETSSRQRWSSTSDEPPRATTSRQIPMTADENVFSSRNQELPVRRGGMERSSEKAASGHSSDRSVLEELSEMAVRSSDNVVLEDLAPSPLMFAAVGTPAAEAPVEEAECSESGSSRRDRDRDKLLLVEEQKIDSGADHQCRGDGSSEDLSEQQQQHGSVENCPSDLRGMQRARDPTSCYSKAIGTPKRGDTEATPVQNSSCSYQSRKKRRPRGSEGYCESEAGMMHESRGGDMRAPRAGNLLASSTAQDNQTGAWVGNRPAVNLTEDESSLSYDDEEEHLSAASDDVRAEDANVSRLLSAHGNALDTLAGLRVFRGSSSAGRNRRAISLDAVPGVLNSVGAMYAGLGNALPRRRDGEGGEEEEGAHSFAASTDEDSVTNGPLDGPLDGEAVGAEGCSDQHDAFLLTTAGVEKREQQENQSEHHSAHHSAKLRSVLEMGGLFCRICLCGSGGDGLSSDVKSKPSSEADESPKSTLGKARLMSAKGTTSSGVARLLNFNPLVSPCKCRGSMQWVHLNCLRTWIEGRLNMRNNGISFFWKPLECELCKQVYPTYVRLAEADELAAVVENGTSFLGLKSSSAAPNTTAATIECVYVAAALGSGPDARGPFPGEGFDGLVVPNDGCGGGGTLASLISGTGALGPSLGGSVGCGNVIGGGKDVVDLRSLPRLIELFEVPRPGIPFIVLEPKSQQGRGYHVVSLAQRKVAKLGRGHESDVRVTDISVSRVHAVLRFQSTPPKRAGSQRYQYVTSAGFEMCTGTKQFIVEDCRSKFGTLLELKRPFRLEPGVTISIQVGRSVLTLTLRKRWRLWPSCFRMSSIEEDIQVIEQPQPVIVGRHSVGGILGEQSHEEGIYHQQGLLPSGAGVPLNEGGLENSRRQTHNHFADSLAMDSFEL